MNLTFEKVFLILHTIFLRRFSNLILLYAYLTTQYHTPSHMNNNCFSYDEIFNPLGSNKFLQTNNLKKFISVHDHHGNWIWNFKDHTLSFAKSTPFDFLAEWSFDKRMIQTPWKKIWFEVVGVMMLQIIIYIYLFIF